MPNRRPPPEEEGPLTSLFKRLAAFSEDPGAQQAQPDATRVARPAQGQEGGPEEEGPESLFQRLAGLFPEGIQALMRGETPADEALRGFARGEHGFQERLAGTRSGQFARSAGQFAAGPAGVGMVVPGIPGGPIVKSIADLRAGLTKMDTDGLLRFLDNVEHTLHTSGGAARGPRQSVKAPPQESNFTLPSFEGGTFSLAQNRAFIEQTSMRRAAEYETLSRALKGDPEAIKRARTILDDVLEMDIMHVIDGSSGLDFLDLIEMHKGDLLYDMIGDDALLMLLTEITGT